MGILGELDRAGLIDTSVGSVHSESLGSALDRWDVMRTKSQAVHEFFRAAPGGVPTQVAFSQSRSYDSVDLDRAGGVIRDVSHAFSTDGGPGMRHPRATGTYAKLVEEYVVRDRKLTIEEMVRKATGFPAQTLRLPDRGVIRVGARADLLVFDPARVKARSTYVDPFAMAEGFDLVMVNGEPAFEGGARVGKSGRLLRAR